MGWSTNREVDKSRDLTWRGVITASLGDRAGFLCLQQNGTEEVGYIARDNFVVVPGDGTSHSSIRSFGMVDGN